MAKRQQKSNLENYLCLVENRNRQVLFTIRPLEALRPQALESIGGKILVGMLIKRAIFCCYQKFCMEESNTNLKIRTIFWKAKSMSCLDCPSLGLVYTNCKTLE